ncbi:hypothetical protein GCM10010302_63180 [Streptomyces polychromogenes]|uniref:Uncharacterized protein n=1 Tax=Streptomyces polychromogenes TaxID=67342 RepID=A0ABP3FGC8_9ACTN
MTQRSAAGYDIAVTALLLLAAATGWSDLVLLVSGTVVPGWALCVVLLCAAVVLAGVRAVRVRFATGRTGAAPSRPVALRVVRGVALVAAALSCAAGALDELGAEYYVLNPTGPGGCTAVVRETSFLVIGSGDVYAIGPSRIGWRPSGSWIADDGYRPVAGGAYELNWSERGGGGTLRVHGTDADPIVSGGIASLDCGS